jgi:hypothetical protein
MSIRPDAEFLADFPDDQIQEDGDIVEFGGRAVAETLAEMLRSGGYAPADPEHQGERGWDINVPVKFGGVWLEVADLGDKFILQSAFYGSFLKMFQKRTDDHAAVVLRLAGGMDGDARFSGVQWRRHGEIDSDKPGASRPDQ